MRSVVSVGKYKELDSMDEELTPFIKDMSSIEEEIKKYLDYQFSFKEITCTKK